MQPLVKKSYWTDASGFRPLSVFYPLRSGRLSIRIRNFVVAGDNVQRGEGSSSRPTESGRRSGPIPNSLAEILPYGQLIVWVFGKVTEPVPSSEDVRTVGVPPKTISLASRSYFVPSVVICIHFCVPVVGDA